MKSWNLFLKSFFNLVILFLFIAILLAAVYYLVVGVALMIGFITFFGFTIGCILLFKSNPSYLKTITIATLVALLVVLLAQPVVGQYLEYKTLFLEILFVLSLWLITLSKRKFSSIINREKIINSQLLIRFNEFFRLINKYKIILSIHLVIVGIYYFYLTEYHTPGLTRFLFSQLSLCLIFVITAYWHIRVCMLHKELNTEKWLSIVNESGSVVGKIAQSVVDITNKRFLFPVVRVAVVCENMLYLSERSAKAVVEPDKTDIPFEKYVEYGKTLDDTLTQILENNTVSEDIKANFIFKHVSKTQVSHRLTYLYVARIPSLQQSNINLEGGKWWYEKQIEENLDKGLFSEFFEKEYEALKNTILLAQRLAK